MFRFGRKSVLIAKLAVVLLVIECFNHASFKGWATLPFLVTLGYWLHRTTGSVFPDRFTMREIVLVTTIVAIFLGMISLVENALR